MQPPGDVEPGGVEPSGVEPIDVEVIPDQEPADIKITSDLTVELQEKRKAFPPQNGEVLRGVHPKSHGCVDAIFTVIPSDYQVGLFKHPRTYKAVIRYSNASVLKLDDLKGGNGSRGMAIKVFGLEEDLGPILLPDDGARNQDFLMVNTPEFAFANVRDYLRLTRILMADRFGADPTAYFIPSILKKSGHLEVNQDKSLKLNPLKETDPEDIRNAWKFYKDNDAFKGFTLADLIGTGLSGAAIANIKSRTVTDPLKAQYFSAAPFRYGPDRVMKFSVVPVDGPENPDNFTVAQDENYLALALKNSMTHKKGENKKPHEFNFMVQVVDESQLKELEDGGEELIENAANAWDEITYPFVKLATITIPLVEEKEGLDFVDACKSLQFTPWHGLAAHEPLGGINRLRKPVYRTSAEFRANPGVKPN